MSNNRSVSNKKKMIQEKKKAIRAKRIRRTVLVFSEVIMVFFLSICCYGVSILNTMQRGTIDKSDIYIATFDHQEDATKQPEETKAVPAESTADHSAEETKPVKPNNVIHVDQVTQAETIDDVLSHQQTVNGYWNILIVGVDARDQANLTSGVNADVIIICSIDVRTKDVKLVSIYRDTLLQMYSSGRYDLANSEIAKSNVIDMISMINKNLDMQIQDVVVVNWEALIRVIDAIGGIYLDITQREIDEGIITGYITEIEQQTGIWQPQITQGGFQLCNGVYAVAYCRNRYTTGMDMGRTNRQREVIEKILEQAKVCPPTALLQAIRYAIPNIFTTLTNDELFHLAADVTGYTIRETTGFPFTYDLALSKSGIFGVIDPLVCTNLAGDVKLLHQFLFGNDGYEPSQTVKNISYEIQNAAGLIH